MFKAQVIMSGELAVNRRWIDSTQLSSHVFWARGGLSRPSAVKSL